MAQYINKNALVAEIERRINRLEAHYADTVEGYAGEISGLKRLLSFLDTLEVKEVEVEKEKPKKPKEDEDYIDLGLPSGTLWKDVNEDGYYSFDKAVEKFGDLLPTKEQCEELKDLCKWEWVGNGCKVTGPNGKSIFLPAAGRCTGTVVYSVGTCGNYWSGTCEDVYYAWRMYFNYFDVAYDMDIMGRINGLSVRLVKH